MSETPAVYGTKAVVTLTDEIVKKYICPLATEQERYMFLQLCKGQNLNPFLREAYLIKYGSSPATMVVGKDTFIKRARSIQTYRGFKAGIIVISNKTVVYREGGMLIKGEELIGGWAEVYRKDLDVPVRAEVSLEEYIGKKKVYENNKVVGEETNAQWSVKPATMIRKVALVQAHREAFPDQFEGLYSGEEMGIDVEAVPEYTTAQVAEGYKPPMRPPEEKKAEPKEGEKEKMSIQQMQYEISKMLFEMHGTEDASANELERLTTWTNKEGKEITGKRDAAKLNDKENAKGQSQTSVTYHQVKKTYEAWKESSINGPDDAEKAIE
jgi:phage recombination protein Bet